MFGNAAGKPSSIAASLFVANESDEIIFHSRCTSAWCLILSVNLLVGVLVLHDGVARISSQDMACRNWLVFRQQQNRILLTLSFIPTILSF